MFWKGFAPLFISLFLYLVQVNAGFSTSVYYSEWSFYNNHLPSDIHLPYVNNIYYAFIEINAEDLTLKFKDPKLATTEQVQFSNHFQINSKQICRGDNLLTQRDTKVIYSSGLIGQLSLIKEKRNDLNMIMSIGGAETNNIFLKVTENQIKIETFVSNVIDFMKKYHFDGVDIDWEFPDSNSTNKVTSLMNELHRQINVDQEIENSRIITMAIPSEVNTLRNFDFRKLDLYISYFNIMGYDMKGVWSDKSGYQSNIYSNPDDPDSGSISKTVSYLLELLPSEKLILGIPAYGISFSTSKLYNDFKGCASIPGIKQDPSECIISYKNLPPKGYIEHYDSKVGAAYAVSNDKTSTGLIVYDSPESVKAKAKFVKEKQLGGAMWWDSDGESPKCDRSLIKSFVDELGGIEVLGLSEINLEISENESDDNHEHGNEQQDPSSSVHRHSFSIYAISIELLFLYIYFS